MSNTYRLEQDRDVICLLDCGRVMASPVSTQGGARVTRLDVAVDVVAAIAAVADELGDRIGVVAFADQVLRRTAPRRDGGKVVVDRVHDLEPRSVDSDYEAALAAVTAHKRAFVLILTDLLDPIAARPLLTSMAALVRHHTVAVVSLRDPAVEEQLSTPSSDVIGLSRTAVAASVAVRRQEVVGELRHRGAVVVDAPLGHVSSGSVSAYLKAKRLARL
jgi:uncharacterized protein (DUF58 family)